MDDVLNGGTRGLSLVLFVSCLLFAVLCPRIRPLVFDLNDTIIGMEFVYQICDIK